jgi:hypothetical protein
MMPDDFQPKIPVDLHIGLSQRRAIKRFWGTFSEKSTGSLDIILRYIYISIELIMPVYQILSVYPFVCHHFVF